MSITIPKVVKEYAKAVAVFIVGIATNMLLDLVNGEKPWPQSPEEWRQYVLTSVGAALAALLVRNKITQKQLDKDPNVIGGVVVDERPTPPPLEPTPAPQSRRSGHPTPWDETL